MRTRIPATAVAIALLAPATAMAVDYPPPSNPGGPAKRPKHTKTLHVCKHGKRCIHTIQKAVKKARAGDTIKVASGTYREGVKISGRKKAFLRLIGNPRKPGKVVIDARHKQQNGVFINGANNVTVSGFTARNYLANGFFALNVDGYDLNHLIAHNGGTYGLYAFNSKGGKMTHSVAYYNNDGGFYIGQTPKQTKPKRSLASHDISWGNVIGWSGTNMRYVTITKSKFFDNGTGIVPNALDSEKFAPPEDNVISNNDVFWNNFDYHVGAPFKLRPPATGSIAYPTGVGILLFGGRRNVVENNRVYGNYLVGIGAIQQFLLKQENARDLVDNVVRGNQMGLGGADKNGRDLFYDGNGSGNCFENNATTSKNAPEDNGVFKPCPGPSPNGFRQDMRDLTIKWATDDPEANWIRNPHAPKAGYNPLEHWAKGFHPGSAAIPARPKTAVASAAGTRSVKVADYYLSPGRLTVHRGSRVVWKWASTNGDTHDVKLKKGPRGVRHFHSQFATSHYSFARRLKKRGKYTVICTLHPSLMHQVITVK